MTGYLVDVDALVVHLAVIEPVVEVLTLGAMIPSFAAIVVSQQARVARGLPGPTLATFGRRDQRHTLLRRARTSGTDTSTSGWFFLGVAVLL